MKNIIRLSIFTIYLTCYSCSEKAPDEKITFNGFWKQMGYGNIIELKDPLIKVYGISKQNCNLSFEEEILDFGKVKNYTKDTLTIQHGIDEWKFTRLDRLPELCQTSTTLNADPKYNFQAFWDTFNEQYASFDIKHIDWDDVYRKYDPKVSENTTDLALYTMFQEMIGMLDDGHVKMGVPEHIENAYKNQAAKTEEKYSKLDEFQLSKELAEIYVDSLYSYNAGMLRYGLIHDKTGYIQINSMLMLADYQLSKALDLRAFFGQYWSKAENIKDEVQRQDEVDGINTILDAIIRKLDGVESYILDIRFNGGGKDGVALAILNHFSNMEKVAFTKKARLPNGFTPKQEIKVVPCDQNFSGPVYLLTSHLTASASEILVLASLSNPNFKRIGSKTEGIFSSTLDKKLPNGWEYELSNEVYQDVEGNNYENIGISADHPLDYSTNKDDFFDQLSDELKNKKDSAIEWALELEKGKIE